MNRLMKLVYIYKVSKRYKKTEYSRGYFDHIFSPLTINDLIDILNFELKHRRKNGKK